MPPPLGRLAPMALVSFSVPMGARYAARLREELVTGCHLELAVASAHQLPFLPFRTLVDELSDDGDGFALAVHAASLAQWWGGVRGIQPAVQDTPFASFGIAGAPCCCAWFRQCVLVACCHYQRLARELCGAELQGRRGLTDQQK